METNEERSQSYPEESYPEETNADDLVKAITAVHENARWAIENGAPKELLLEVIDNTWQQVVCHCEAKKQDQLRKQPEP